MKRFLCLRCKRTVRCRRLPIDVRPNPEPHDPAQRLVGTCAHHETAQKRKSV